MSFSKTLVSYTGAKRRHVVYYFYIGAKRLFHESMMVHYRVICTTPSRESVWPFGESDLVPSVQFHLELLCAISCANQGSSQQN